MENSLWLSWWQDADWVVRGVLMLLIGLSVASWSIMLYKARQLLAVRRAEQALTERLQGNESTALERLPDHFLVATLRHVLRSGRRVSREGLEARLGQAVRARRTALESGLTVLATIGNGAPFIGLLGTVWGIMHALQALGGAEALTLDAIAGPVAEALVATAVGLFTAIPAVAGYNTLLRQLRRLVSVMDGNAVELVECALFEVHGMMDSQTVADTSMRKRGVV